MDRQGIQRIFIDAGGGTFGNEFRGAALRIVGVRLRHLQQRKVEFGTVVGGQCFVDQRRQEQLRLAERVNDARLVCHLWSPAGSGRHGAAEM